MKYVGSQTIETERLLLKAQTIKEQRRLWEILMIPEVNRYYLTVPQKFRKKLSSWPEQEDFYKQAMQQANELNVFEWRIFLKDTNTCIGKISCNETGIDPNIRDVGWYIDPDFQGKGYGTEAAKAMIDFMFYKAEIEKIITGAAIYNQASWKIMEHLGFERQKDTKMIQYTFSDKLTEDYIYVLTKEKYLEHCPSAKE